MIKSDLLKTITQDQTRKHQVTGRCNLVIYDLKLRQHMTEIAETEGSNFSSLVHNSLRMISDMLESPQTTMKDFTVEYPAPSIRDNNDKWIRHVRRLRTKDELDDMSARLTWIFQLLTKRRAELEHREYAILQSKQMGLTDEQIQHNLKEITGDDRL